MYSQTTFGYAAFRVYEEVGKRDLKLIRFWENVFSENSFYSSVNYPGHLYKALAYV